MKLHLPLGLRTALLSCLAVVGSGFTACSGTIAAVGAVTIVVASSTQASGEWVPPFAYPGAVTVATATTTPLVITQNSTITYSYAGDAGSITAAGFDIKLAASGVDKAINLGTAGVITAKSVWVSLGRFYAGGTALANAGDIYVQGGQFFVGPGDFNNHFYIGSSTYSGDGDFPSLQRAALRIDSGTISGAIDLIEDAAIGQYMNGTATLSGLLTTGNYKLTKQGDGTVIVTNLKDNRLGKLALTGGIFQAKLPNALGSAVASFGEVTMGGGILSVWNEYENTSAGSLYQTLDTLVLNGNAATLQTTNKAGGWLVKNITGENKTLVMDFAGSTEMTQYSLIEAASFSGTLEIKQSNNGGLRSGILGVSNGALANTIINMSQKLGTGDSYVAFAVGGAVGNKVNVLGLNGGAGAYVVSYDLAGDTARKAVWSLSDLLALNQARTLVLSGTGVYSFSGTIGNNLTIEKTGTGSQGLGNLGNNVTVNLRQGSIKMSSGTIGTGSVINTSAGTSVIVPWVLNGNTVTYNAAYNDYLKPFVVGEGGLRGDVISAIGNTTDGGGGDGTFTILNPAGYTGTSVTIDSGLISICEGGGGATNANFGTITKFVLNGGGLVVPANANTYTLAQDIEFKGFGYLRAYSGTAQTTLTGAITGNGTLTKTDSGVITLGGDMSQFTGGAVIGGGTLIFDTDASLSSFAMRTGTNLKVINGHKLNATSGTFDTGNTILGMALEGGGNVSFNRINFNAAATINMTSATNGSVTTKQFTGANTGNTVLNVGANTALNVTGSTVLLDYGTFVGKSTFVLAHWNGSATYTISGTLNMLNCPTFAIVNPSAAPRMTVKSGGVLNLQGLNILWRDGINSDRTFKLTMETGSMMNLGSAGINTMTDALYGKVDLILNGGTLGILDSTKSWTSGSALTLNGDVTVNTQLYTAATDGKAGVYTNSSGTITLSGAITGTGTLIKQGEGTLLLNNVSKLDVKKGFVGVTGGNLTIGTLNAMTADGGRFALNLGSDKVTATSYAGLVNLNLAFSGGTLNAGGYDVFLGAAGLTKENVNILYFLDRGLTAGTVTVNGGVVHVTLGGALDPNKYDVTWAGGAGATWVNSDSSAWTGVAAAKGRFSTGDKVIFNGGGTNDVTIVGQVNPGSIEVSGTENYSFNGGSLTGSGALTKSGTGRLSIGSETSLSWTGDVNLQGGTIAFRDGLGKSNHINVSGTVGLEWLSGNPADISSRIVMANGANLTFNTGTSAVVFGTKIAGTGNYVKTGSGSLTLNVLQALTGNVTVDQGDLILGYGGNPGDGVINGTVTVNDGGRLVLAAADSTGWKNSGTLSSLTINKGGSMLIDETANQTFTNMTLTLQGGTISGVNSSVKFDLGNDATGTTSVVTLASDQTSVISTVVSIRQVGGVTFTVADGSADTDLLISNDVKSLRGDKVPITESLTKAGAGTMRITGTYSAGAIKVDGGKLVVGNGLMGASDITLAQGTNFVIQGGTFKWGSTGAERFINNGTITLESDGTMWTNSDSKSYGTTLGADVTLTGSGKWITGIAKVSDQTNGNRSLTINGKTAGFTGVLELQGTGGAADSAFSTQLVLNSADGVLGGVIRMQGVTQNNGWAVNDAGVIPTSSRILLKKSMAIGGIEGKGGILEMDVAAGANLTLGDSGDHTFSGSMKGAFKNLTKTGTGTQTLNGDLSASIAGIETVTVSGGKLSLGSTNYAGNVTLSGVGAALAAGKVTIGAGKTLTVTKLTTVIDSNLDVAGGSVILGTEMGDYSVGLNNHSLNLSSTSRTNLSLALSDQLNVGDFVTLFSGVSGLTNDSTALTLADGALLSDYFNVSGISGLTGAKLRLKDGKLEIVLTRSTKVIVYGRGDNGVWATGEAFTADNTAFVAGGNVTFDKLQADKNSIAVQLKGDLDVGGMIIDPGAGKTYTFKQLDGGKIASLLDMRVNSGTAVLNSGVLAPTAATTIIVGGATLELQTGSTNDKVALSLDNGATLKWGTGNTTDYSSLGGISVKKDANITLDINSNSVTLGKAIANSATYTVKGGNLTLGNHDVLSGAIILGNAGNLILKEASTPGAAYAINISGTGDVSIDGANAVTLSGTNSYSGATNLLANSRLNVTDKSLSTKTSQISLAAGSTFDYTATQNATLDRKLTGTGNVIFQGAKEITLTGANDYTGTTTIAKDTTLKVSNTSIGGAGNAIINNGTLSIDTGATAYAVAQAISGTGALKLQGTNLTWDITGKTYTGNTTIVTGSTVSSAGALTSGVLGDADVRLVTVETGSKLILTDAAATDAWLDNGGSNDKGLFLRGDGTVRLQFTGEVTSDGFVAKAFQNAGTLGKLELASGSSLNLSSDRNAKLSTVKTISVESGANITMGTGTWGGDLLTIAGAGISGSDASSDKAAALTLKGSAGVSRSLSLADNATVRVVDGYSWLTGTFSSNGHTLTKTGAGSLVLGKETLGGTADTRGKINVLSGTLSFALGASEGSTPAYVWQGAVSLADKTTLNKDDGYVQIAGGVNVDGDVTITSNWSKGWDLGAISGSGTINLKRGDNEPTKSEQLILGAENGFTGTWNVASLWTLNVDHANALSKASVALGTSSLQLGVASADLVGLTGDATSSLTMKSTMKAGTLGITGAATATFSGSVANGVTVEMNGTGGTQTLNGTLSNGSNFIATKGNLTIASTGQSGSHVFTANGGTLNMQGYTRNASAPEAEKDSFVFKSGSIANLTLGKGMEIQADDSFAGAVSLTGSTVLDGGTMVFRMTDNEVAGNPGYYALANSYAIANGSVSMGTGADKTMLTFIPVSKPINPGTDDAGQTYTLISGVGSGVSADDLSKFKLNMSSEGRTKYTLGLKDGNLVLNVKGSAGFLTWEGGDSHLWNTAEDNLAWLDKGSSTRFYDDDLVLFDTLAGSASETVTVHADGVLMGGMTVTGSTNYTFNGGAISSSVGNTNAGLTVGTVGTDAKAFTGTLTLNTANSYAGDTTVNSGTVIANNKDALSNTKLIINGGTVRLGFVGTLGTSSVEMAGGGLDFSATGGGATSVNNVVFTGADSVHTMTASAGHALSITPSSNAIAGAWVIGSATDVTKTGFVQVEVGTLALTHGQDVTVNSGGLILNGTTGSYTGSHVVLDGGELTISGGLTATLKSLKSLTKGNGASNDITQVLGSSTLAFSEETTVASQINMLGGTLHGAAGLTLGKVYLYEGNTSLTGTVMLDGIARIGENNTATLSVGKAGTAGSVVLGTSVTSLHDINVVNGTLTVKNGDKIGQLTSSGTVTTQATSATLLAETAVLNAGSSLADAVTLTLTGKDSWLGENGTAASAATVGKVVLEGTGATAHMGDKLAAQDIVVKKGTLFLDKTTGTVQNGITLNGSQAKFDMMGNASALAVTMNQGGLAQSSAYTGTITVDDLTLGRWAFDMGGLTNNALVEMDHLASGSSLKNLKDIKLGNSTISLAGGMNSIFVMTGSTGIVSMDSGAQVTFITNGVIDRVQVNGSETFRLTNGSLSGLTSGIGFKDGIVFDPTLGLYNIKASAKGGNLILTSYGSVDSDSIYQSTKDGTVMKSYNAMDTKSSVNINANTTIDLTDATATSEQEKDGLILKNLHNTSEAKTTLTITGTTDDLVTLNNNLSSTWFNGSINVSHVGLIVNNTNASANPEEKASDRELLIQGTLTSDGVVSIQNGRLILGGDGNVLGGGLSLNEDLVDNESVKGVLVVRGNTSLGGLISGDSGATAANILVEKTTLTLKAASTLDAWVSGTGTESLAIEGGGTATFGEHARVDKLGLFIDENRTAAIETTQEGALAFNGLTGKGTLTGREDASVTLDLAAGKSSVFSGNLDAYTGTMIVKGAGSQSFDTSMNAYSSLLVDGGNAILKTSGLINMTDPDKLTEGDRSYGSVAAFGAGSKLTIQTAALTDKGMAVNNKISMNELTIDHGTLAFSLNLTNDLKTTSGVVASVTDGTSINGAVVDLHIGSMASDFAFDPGQEMTLFLMSGITDADNVTLKSGSLLDKYYSSSSIFADNGYLYVTGTTVTGDTARFHMDAALSETGRAGAGLLDYLYATRNPQLASPDSLAAAVLNSLETIILSGDRNTADRVMAGVAGSTVTSMSAAFASSLTDRIDSIRNRMTGMGADQSVVNEDLPGFHAWISADGGYNDLSTDGRYSGYTLNTWGGTIGVDVDVSERVTIGAAFSASYGDLTADAAESARGDLDSYTVTAFARIQAKRWNHDFAVAGSSADATLRRTVNYGDGSYSTNGTTSGFGMAAMYEASYSIPVGEDKENLFQPLFRASFTHASMDSYSESDAGAMGLNVGKQSVNYATFGVGARYLANVGQNLFNRNSILELRALVLQDAGSRRGEADVALSGAPERSRRVKGAEPGTTGIQVGAGLTIPVQTAGAIFADVSLNARSKMTTVNGSIGYRINF